VSEFLSLILGGVVGGFVGAFLGGFAKFFWENWLPSQLTWRHQQQVDREKFLAQYRDPAMRATSDLHNRIYHLLTREDIEYLKGIGYEDYYITSTTFLIAQFFAWMEILHRRVAMLDYYKLMNRFAAVGQSFSDGGPGLQIFHLEQREIGERMIISSSQQEEDSYSCMGYSDFLNLIEKDTTPLCFSALQDKVRKIVTGDTSMKRAIFQRFIHTQHTLIDLMDFIDPRGTWKRHSKTKLQESDTLLSKPSFMSTAQQPTATTTTAITSSKHPNEI